MSLDSDVFFWRLMNCWGWATWKDRWDFIDTMTENKKVISPFKKFYNTERKREVKALNNIKLLFPTLSLEAGGHSKLFMLKQICKMIMRKFVLTYKKYSDLQVKVPVLESIIKQQKKEISSFPKLLEKESVIKFLNKKDLLQEYKNIQFNDLADILDIVRVENPNFILELGSGLSTLVLTDELKQSGGQLISIDERKNRSDYIWEKLKNYKLNNAYIYQTQVNYQIIENQEWLGYDMSFFPMKENEYVYQDQAKYKNKKINMLILREELEQYQSYSSLMIIPQLVEFLDKNVVILSSQLSNKNKIVLDYWIEYLKNKILLLNYYN